MTFDVFSERAFAGRPIVSSIVGPGRSSGAREVHASLADRLVPGAIMAAHLEHASATSAACAVSAVSAVSATSGVFDAASGTALAEAPPTLNGRYEIVRDLGQGGMGSVVLVKDLRQGGRLLALKRVRSDRLDRRIVTILRNEFLALAALRHPGLAGVHDFGVDRETGDCFFTCEFVDGVGLLEACRSLRIESGEDVRLLLDIFAQILRALQFIHTAGLVHGDIKPENILITDAARGPGGSPCAKLIDFGLTRRSKDFGGKKVLGTSAYIAPETISGLQVDGRADLYSLGCVLYQVVTGRLPFTGESNIAVLRGHVEGTAAPPSAVRPSIPEALDAVILRLLEKKPSGRFHNALEVIEALAGAFGVDLPLETPETARTYLRAARPAGASDLLAKLCAAFATVCKVSPLEADQDLHLSIDEVLEKSMRDGHRVKLPEGRLVLLRGEKGLGKRAVIDEFKDIVQAHGARFLAIDCGRAEARPGADFLSLVEEIEGLVPPGEPLPRWFEVSCSLANSLLEEKPTPEILQAVHGLARLFLGLTQAQPTVLHAHDLHAASGPFMSFVWMLVECQSKRLVPYAQLLATATAGDSEDMEASGLRKWLRTGNVRGSVLELAVQRVGQEGVARLLAAMCPGSEFPERFVGRVFEASDGNPEVVREILEHLLDRGILRRTPAGWSIDGDFERETVPGKARAEIAARIDRLPAPALRLAYAFAVLGNVTELELAAQLAQTSREEVLGAMRCLCRARILEEDPRPGKLNVYSFLHGTAREILYRRIPEDTRRTLHDLAGRLALSFHGESSPEGIKKVAAHYLIAGNRDEGIRHGIAAARVNAREHDDRGAVELYRGVLALNGDRDPALGQEVRYDMAVLLHEIGEHRPALEILSPLAESRSRDGRRPHPTHAHVEAARSAVVLGELQLAAKHLEKAAALEKSQVLPVGLPQVLLGYGELCARLGKHLESIRYCERVLESRAQLHDPRTLLRLFRLLAEGHEAVDDRDRAIDACREALAVVDGGRPEDLAHEGTFFMGLYYRLQGKLSKAALQFAVSMALRARHGLIDAQAEAALELGATNMALDRPGNAARVLRHSRSLFDRTGNLQGRARTLCLLGEAHALLGEYEDARNSLTESIHAAKRSGRLPLIAETHVACARICIDCADSTGGDRYLSEAEKVSGLGALQQLRIIDLRAERAFERGQLALSLEEVGRGLEISRKHKLRAQGAPFLRLKAVLEIRVGRREDARRTTEALRDLGRRHGLPLVVARSRLVEALLAEDGAIAGRAFQAAAKVFQAEASERDLIPFYLEYGLTCLESGQIEQAYLCLEEAGYLAKKLNLNYWRCRAQLATGCLEERVVGNDLRKPAECFALAERWSAQWSFADILWRAQLHLGRLLRKQGRQTDAVAVCQEAARTREDVARGLAPSYRDSFMAEAPGPELDSLLRECTEKAGTTEGCNLPPS